VIILRGAEAPFNSIAAFILKNIKKRLAFRTNLWYSESMKEYVIYDPCEGPHGRLGVKMVEFKGRSIGQSYDAVQAEGKEPLLALSEDDALDLVAELSKAVMASKKRRKLFYAYRSTSGKAIRTYDWYVGTCGAARAQAVAQVKEAFRNSITPLVWIGSPKTPAN
jgi:hypothetical protein